MMAKTAAIIGGIDFFQKSVITALDAVIHGVMSLIALCYMDYLMHFALQIALIKSGNDGCRVCYENQDTPSLSSESGFKKRNPIKFFARRVGRRRRAL